MRKTMNLQASSMTEEAKAYILAGGADSIVLWAPPWMHLEPVQGQVDESQWALLDANVAWAHEHRLEVFISVVSNEMPAWLTGPWSDGKILLWSRFYVGRVMARYPGCTIIPLNEPDYTDISAKAAATMMLHAAHEARDRGHKRILAPATATLRYALKVLWYLRGWKPPIKVGFAHHQYIDVGNGNTAAARALLVAMRATRWHDGVNLWLTEGGLIFRTALDPGAPGWDPSRWHYAGDMQARQRSNVIKHFKWAKRSGKVQMWAQYEYRDSMWYGWASGMVRFDGTPKPLRAWWLSA